MNDQFLKFIQLRAERAGAKYVLPNGENQANYRNSGLDALEEIGDCTYILMLWKEKLEKEEHTFNVYMCKSQIDSALESLEYLWCNIMFIYKAAPEQTTSDSFPDIKRHVLVTKDGEIK